MSPIKALLPGVYAAMLLGGCATRPANPPIAQLEPTAGNRFESRLSRSQEEPNLVVLDAQRPG